MAQNYGLGRGLSSLIPQKKINREESETKNIFSYPEGKIKERETNSSLADEFQREKLPALSQGVLEVDIDKISANPYQPRVDFNEEKLKELADSIREHGVLQPLVVTKNGEKFELIAGERRLQASKLASLKKVPVIVKDIKDKQKLELAIVENIQRHNLNPIEEAQSFQQLITEFQMNQEEVAQKMGKSRSVVANKIRLLKLPVEALRALKEEVITEGHAKAILSLENQEKQRALLDLIIKNHWTVRQAEDKTREISDKPQRKISSIDPEIKELEDKLTNLMGTKVKVKKTMGDGGKIIIDYYSGEELNKIISSLDVKRDNNLNLEENNYISEIKEEESLDLGEDSYVENEDNKFSV